MYAGPVTCCPLVSNCEDADGTEGQTDGHQALQFSLNAACIAMACCLHHCMVIFVVC